MARSGFRNAIVFALCSACVWLLLWGSGVVSKSWFLPLMLGGVAIAISLRLGEVCPPLPKAVVLAVVLLTGVLSMTSFSTLGILRWYWVPEDYTGIAQQQLQSESDASITGQIRSKLADVMTGKRAEQENEPPTVVVGVDDEEPSVAIKFWQKLFSWAGESIVRPKVAPTTAMERAREIHAQKTAVLYTTLHIVEVLSGILCICTLSFGIKNNQWTGQRSLMR